jgi:hypothetical protein
MHDEIRIETDLFEHREVKPHFINPCCFGEDFAQWLIDRAGSLRDQGFELFEPIQEDYGWGFWIKKEGDQFWLALSYVGEGASDEPAEWVVSLNYDPGLNIVKRFFHKPNLMAFNEVRDLIWSTIKSTPAIKVYDDQV